jgi:hypothetical protein
MAAKQGLSAQISQASEDAKRAVLNRTSLTNSLWFSNLNTTCTIKSAPPRSPDVLGLLSTKSGWLFKRNEQHVWQTRYCCVVPHTFMYYFDAHPTNPCQTPTLTPKQQEHLNKAVRQGYGKRGASKQNQPRSSLYAVLGASNPDTDTEPSSATQGPLQPAGIIDLECYSTIHRNSQDDLLMELAGDETVNPDLRSFYFCANNEEEGEEWTQALLSNRHSSLVDEKEAYRQVCDGFAQQLQVLHTDLENATHQAENQQEDLYRVRSQHEDTRRSCLRLVQDTLERSEGTVPAKRAYRTDLETIQAQDLGILAAVQLLCDYTRVLEETCRDSGETISNLEERLEQKQEGDHSKVTQLEEEIDFLKEEMKQHQANTQSQMATLTQKYIQSQKECQDVQKDLASQRMEMTMYQSATRTKIGELQSHKKILKKEVIDLRKKLEETHSNLDLFKHKESSVKLEVEQERQKAHLLERYVEKMESQVKVQQNMMEMISCTGSHSQYGGGSHFGGDMDYQRQFASPSSAVRSEYTPSGKREYASSSGVRSVNEAYTPSGKREYGDSSGVRSVVEAYTPSSKREYGDIIVNTPSSVQPDEDEYEEDHPVPVSTSKRITRPSRNISQNSNDDDAKSHMSELTEDRTQRHFDAAFYFQQQEAKNERLRVMAAASASPSNIQPMGGPPAIIGVSEDAQSEKDGNTTPKKLDTIMSSSHSARRPRSNIPRYDAAKPLTPRSASAGEDAGSLSSFEPRQKLSVAQRARLEADRGNSTPVRVRAGVNSTPLRGNSTGSARKEPSMRLNLPNASSERSISGRSASGSFLSSLGRRIGTAIDNSLLGVEDSDSSYQSTEIGTNTDIVTDDEEKIESTREEKKMSDTASVASTVCFPADVS